MSVRDKFKNEMDDMDKEVALLEVALMDFCMDNDYNPQLFGIACDRVADTVKETVIRSAIELAGGEDELHAIMESDNPQQALLDKCIDSGKLPEELRDILQEEQEGETPTSPFTVVGGKSIH